MFYKDVITHLHIIIVDGKLLIILTLKLNDKKSQAIGLAFFITV